MTSKAKSPGHRKVHTEARLRAEALLHEGWRIGEVAEQVGVHYTTVQRWKRKLANKIEEQSGITEGDVADKAERMAEATRIIRDPDASPRDKIAAMDYQTKVDGGYAPMRSENVQLSIIHQLSRGGLDIDDELQKLETEASKTPGTLPPGPPYLPTSNPPKPQLAVPQKGTDDDDE
jgi:hypothetical protein